MISRAFSDIKEAVKSSISVGDTLKVLHFVKKEQTTNRFELPGYDILSTPDMIMLMEVAAADYLEEKMPLIDGYASVGWKVDIIHKAPAFLSDEVEVTASVADVKGKKVGFTVSCTDLTTGVLVGEGYHGRAIIPAPEEAVEKARKM
eukprot:gnl/Dysnectes_brevis/1402_a1580_3139.p1 GENE.gnl/Dysnectes_brevis/1402_a1580_3139~~gnl/Dysnectes_brevis/1402_a1580_3139.p1  ORF type:complete len:147 (+),score=45.24 gnl/Dysnectes_brevis/1402_a1580_3139:20-460(+)